MRVPVWLVICRIILYSKGMMQHQKRKLIKNMNENKVETVNEINLMNSSTDGSKLNEQK